MIDSVSHVAAQQIFKQSLVEHTQLRNLEVPSLTPAPQEVGKTQSFENVVGKLVQEVDAKRKASVEETNKMLLGETDNIHQSMIAMQESGLAFNLMVEVRNKLMQSFQELIKMAV